MAIRTYPKTYQYYHSRSVFLCCYHFVFGRRSGTDIFQVPGVYDTFLDSVASTCSEVDSQVIAYECTPTYVHLLVQCPPNTAPSEVVGKIKSMATGSIRRAFPQLDDGKSFWLGGYFISTDTHLTQENIENYIRAQQDRERIAGIREKGKGGAQRDGNF